MSASIHAEFVENITISESDIWEERLWDLKAVRDIKGQEPFHTNRQTFSWSELP